MRKNIFNPFYLLLATAFLLFGSVAYADEVTNYFYNTTTCPESVDSYSCGSDYIILKSPKTCKTGAEMTSAYNACYAVAINGIHQDMRCDYTNACYWHSDPNTTKCSTLYRSFTQLNNPTAACGACVSGYTDCSGTCKINKTCPSGYTPNTCADTCTLAAQKVKELPVGSGTWVTEITENTVGGGASLWTKLADPSNDIYYNAGKVGIGTATPASKLEVVGVVRTKDSAAGTNYLETGINNTTGYGYINTNDTFGLQFTHAGSTNAKMTITSAGNVGIGTTTPGSKLTVAGANAGLDVFAHATDNEGLRLQTHRSADNQTSSRILFSENNSEMYGFSLLFAGSASQTFGSTNMNYLENKFHIIRHNNNLIGNAAVTIDRTNGHVGVAGSDSYVGYGLAVNDGAIINLSEDYGEGLRVVSGGNNARGIVSQTLGSDSISFSNLCTNCIAASFSGVENDGTKAVVKITNDAHTLLIDGNEIDSSVALYLNNNSDKDVILARGGGNVGIDISSPQTNLHVHDISSNTSQIQLTNNFTGSASGDGALISESGSALWLVNRESGQLYIQSSEDAYIRFRGDTERARIGPDYTNFSGNVGIGTVPSYKLDVSGNMRIDTSTYDADDYVARFMVDGSTRFGLKNNGGVVIGTNTTPPDRGLYVYGNASVGSLTNRSSERFKNSIQPLSEDTDVYDILKLEPKIFKYNDFDEVHLGYIAEDVERTGLKYLVSYNENGSIEGLHYDKIPVYLLEVIKDQQKTIEDLKFRIELLESK